VTEGDASNGKALFVSKCGSCHTLGDAKSQGAIGPNLDDAFESDKRQGFKEQTIRDVVRGQIAYPVEPMPANLVRGDDADAVAVYVAKCAAVSDCGVRATQAAAPEASGGDTTTAASGGGGTSGSALAQGKAIFTGAAGCGGCHTLKDAGTSGNVGPNLDEAKPSKALAVTRVTHGKAPMPAFKGQLSASQIAAVATYVSSVAGK
jgi:mono/diheme cytochrome c family protein